MVKIEKKFNSSESLATLQVFNSHTWLMANILDI